MPDPHSEGLPRPLSAKELQALLQSPTPPLVVDVREQQELAMAPFPGDVVHLPLSGAQQWMDGLPARFSSDQNVVVLCHAGVRSWQFGCWLLAQMPELKVWNLEGGIDAWSTQVDSSVPRY